MTARVRQKACLACASSKRSCDKQIPVCQRCLDREIDCLYPQPKRRRRDLPTSSDLVRQAQEPHFFHPHGNSASLDSNGVLLGDWDAFENTDLDFPPLEEPILELPTLPDSLLETSMPVDVSGSITAPKGPSPWFLCEESWVLTHTNQDSKCENVEYEPFIEAVKAMLKSWIDNGKNGFMHRRLYESGMPTCLQEAFTTLAAYLHSTPAMKSTILQIAEERASTLINQSLPPEDIRAHVARVHALFVYEFMRLFDGSIRLRASAERQVPILRSWVSQMWEAAMQSREHEDGFDHHSLQVNRSVVDFNSDFERSSRLWKQWILNESVRRTQIIIDTVCNIYQTMTTGWAECSGVLMFTPRRDMWEAASSMQWFELSCTKYPLLVPALEPDPWMSRHNADDFDDFAKMCWTCIVGAEKMQCWIGRSSKSNTV